MPQLLVLAIPFQDLDQRSYQNQLDWFFRLLPSKSELTANLNQDAAQNAAAVGTGNTVFKTLTKTAFRSNSA